MIMRAGRLWTAYLGKAEDALLQVEPEVILLLTDPPYGIGYSSGYRPQPMTGDDEAGRESVYAVLSLAVSKFARATQHLYVFGDWDLTKVKSVYKSAELVWDKIGPVMGDLGIPWSGSYEHIQFAVGHKTARGRSEALMRKRRGSVLRHYAVTGTRASRHPVEKPVPLLRELIEMSSAWGDLVLDPYMGCGSTGVAAILEGRRFIGVECEPGWFATSCSRLAAAESIVLAQEGL